MVSSRDKRRKQNNWQQYCPDEVGVKPQGNQGGPSKSPARAAANTSGEQVTDLLEKVLERGNMFRALDRVERNAGAPGIDGLATKELRKWCKENWPSVKEQLLNGSSSSESNRPCIIKSIGSENRAFTPS